MISGVGYHTLLPSGALCREYWVAICHGGAGSLHSPSTCFVSMISDVGYRSLLPSGASCREYWVAICHGAAGSLHSPSTCLVSMRLLHRGGRLQCRNARMCVFGN